MREKTNHFINIFFFCNTYEASTVNSFFLKQDPKHSIKQILTQKYIKQRKCILCKSWMDAHVYRWETDECFYWHPVIYQPVSHKANIRKSTNYDVSHSCTSLKGFWRTILSKDPHLVCFFSGILRAVQKVFQIKFIIFCIFLTWENSFVLRSRNFLGNLKEAIQCGNSRRPEARYTLCSTKSFFKILYILWSNFPNAKVVPANILNKLLHRHIYHWRRCAQKADFVTTKAFNRYLQI